MAAEDNPAEQDMMGTAASAADGDGDFEAPQADALIAGAADATVFPLGGSGRPRGGVRVARRGS